MKICMKHWNMLRDAIEQRGLSGLVGKSGEELMENTVAQIEGTKSVKETFDPLANATWMIYGRALQLGGLYLLQEDDICPICEAIVHRADGYDANETVPSEEETEKFWIDGPTDATLEQARELGLTPKLQ